MQETEKDGPSGLLVDLWRRVWPGEQRRSARGGGIDATLTMCATAVILSIGGWTKPGLEPFVLDERGFGSEPWRLFSTHFVHVNIIHLWFNLSWIWSLGRAIEQRLGPMFLIGTSAFIMLGTSAVVQAFDRGGIGLSGVVYGLWAMIFVAQRRCPILQGILDARTNQLMVLWFFFCIVATITGTFPVSNWGHGGGAVLGALVGWAIAEDGRLRAPSLPLGCALLALLTCGATVWWPKWNFGGAAIELERRADDAIGNSDWKAAERALRRAVEVDPGDSRAWWNLGCVLSNLGRNEEAADACYRAWECGDLKPAQARSLREQAHWAIENSNAEGSPATAFQWARRLTKLEPSNPQSWEELLRQADASGEKEEAQRARAALDKLGGNR